MKKTITITLLTFTAALLLCSEATPAAAQNTATSTVATSQSEPADDDRVNLWPLLYYNNRSLSVLWPLITVSDSILAVRPLFSIYNRDTPHPEYNILWPIAQFDTATGNNRVFPFFWGSDYFVGFPLYWRYGKPGDHHGTSVLFPLWLYNSKAPGSYNLHLLWPVLNRRHYPNDTGWRLWPIIGNYNDHGNRHSYLLWPLAHRWSNASGEERGNCLVPLWFYNKTASDSLLISPLYYRGREGNYSWDTLLPIYHRTKSPEKTAFYSLPYSSGTNAFTRASWSLAMPLWFRKEAPHKKIFATLLGGYKKSDDATNWLAWPLLAAGSFSPDRHSLWLLGPLAHFSKSGNISTSHIFPLYYKKNTPDTKLFYSLPWSAGTTASGRNWQMLPPVFYREHTATSKMLITPLYASGSSTNSHWHSIVPLWFRRNDGSGRELLATPLGGYRTDGNTTGWLAWPLLTGGSFSPDYHSLWLLGPLAHFSKSGDISISHIFPLYYRNSGTSTFVSIPYAHWKYGNKETGAIPLLLSWKTTTPERSDTWLLGPLAHFSSGKKPGSSHIFPLYYRNPTTGTLLSLPYSSITDEGVHYRIFPLLLSMYVRSGPIRSFYGLLGLYRHQTDSGKLTSDRLLPIYDYRKGQHFLSLLFGWRHGRNGFFYPFTPLVGIRSGDYTGGWIFPFWSRRRSKSDNSVSGTFLWGSYWHNRKSTGSQIIPFYSYNRIITESGATNTTFWSLPWCTYRNITTPLTAAKQSIHSTAPAPHHRHHKESSFFPLWRKSSDKTIDSAGRILNQQGKFSLLLFLYDSKHKSRTATATTPAQNYTRRRLLWRVWHYERENDNLRVDIFPAITYDKHPDGFRKFSFLWRFIRYEKGPRGKKMDILFIPVMRKKAAPTPSKPISKNRKQGLNVKRRT